MVGRDHINYPYGCRNPRTNLPRVNFLLNSIVPTAGADFVSLNIKKFYLSTPLNCFEYLRLKLDHFPEDDIEPYKLKKKATHDGYIYRVNKSRVCLTPGRDNSPTISGAAIGEAQVFTKPLHVRI